MVNRLWIPLLLICCLAPAQAQDTPTAAPSKPAVEAAKAPTPHVVTSDIPDLTAETQLTIREPHYAGLVWWMPYQFFEQTSGPEAADAIKPMQNYLIVGIFAAKVSALGTFDFIPAADLHSHVVVRDKNGTDYSALAQVAPEAEMFGKIMKPMLSAALGRAGDNFELLFFPAKTASGEAIADPTREGSFSIVFKDLVGTPESIFLYRTPLTSLVATKICPAGKERVRANWKYCPWHGVSLTADTPVAAPAH